MNKVKVLHLGCSHDSNDPRIRKKECVTLYRAGYDVVYITSYQSLRDEDQSGQSHDGIIIKGGDYDTRGVLVTRDVVSFIKYRIKNKKKIVELIIIENPDVLHIHELELMYVVNKVRRILPNIKVIFDIHEDFPGSYYDVFAANTNKWVAWVASRYVNRRLKKYIGISDAIITVTPAIKAMLSNYCDKVNLVRNYPIVRIREDSNSIKKSRQVCYCGMMSEGRGISTLLEVAKRINGEIHLAGQISHSYCDELDREFQWRNSSSIKYHGEVSQEEVMNIYDHSIAGICCYKKTKNNYCAYPTKIFEYMMAGIPVICSDFPAWREIVEDANCGILVNPDNSDAIGNAINNLLDDRQKAIEMGENGKKAVLLKYNWESEAKELIRIYMSIAPIS